MNTLIASSSLKCDDDLYIRLCDVLCTVMLLLSSEICLACVKHKTKASSKASWRNAQQGQGTPHHKSSPEMCRLITHTIRGEGKRGSFKLSESKMTWGRRGGEKTYICKGACNTISTVMESFSASVPAV